MSLIVATLKKAELYQHLSKNLDEQQCRRLDGFLELRAQWSQIHNLSGPKALSLLGTDIADAVAVWLCMDPNRSLIDIGSGSGAPGLMVACLSPQQDIHLVEPIAKRCAFMKTAAHKLGLNEVKVHRGRWPEVAQDITDSIAISRAVVSPEEWPILADQPQVSGMMQMLAHHRPPWPLPQYTLAKSIHYVDPEGGQRRVNRWDKHEI